MTKKVAIVFGGSGGIGQTVVKKLSAHGVHVCSVYHEKQGNSQYQIDIRDELSVRQGMERILVDCGRVDIVVFSVSLSLEHKGVLEREWSDYQQHLDVQVKGLFQVVKNLSREIKNQGGIRFIIILSEAVVGTPPAGFSSYVTAKYALLGLAKSLAVELARYQCTVNMISPGMVETSLLSAYPPKAVEFAASSNPLQRIATPLDVAGAVLFLAGEDASYINGAHLTVNGGAAML